MTSKQKRERILAYQNKHGCSYKDAQIALGFCGKPEEMNKPLAGILTGPDCQNFLDNLPKRKNGLYADLGTELRKAGHKGIRIHNQPLHEIDFKGRGDDNGIRDMVITFGETNQHTGEGFFASSIVKVKNDKHAKKIVDEYSSYTMVTIICEDVGKAPLSAPNGESWIPLKFTVCHENSMSPVVTYLDGDKMKTYG